MKLALHAVRFGLELCLLGAVVYWALELDVGTAVCVALAFLSPVAIGVFWGLYIAPKARYPLPRPLWVALQLVLFGLVGGALATVGQAWLGGAFVVAAVVDLAALIAVSGEGLRGTGAPGF